MTDILTQDTDKRGRAAAIRVNQRTVLVNPGGGDALPAAERVEDGREPVAGHHAARNPPP